MDRLSGRLAVLAAVSSLALLSGCIIPIPLPPNADPAAAPVVPIPVVSPIRPQHNTYGGGTPTPDPAPDPDPTPDPPPDPPPVDGGDGGELPPDWQG